jgi:toxin CcdB
MAQFSVYRNPNPDSRDTAPYLVDIQHDLLSNLGTRVVIPLFTAERLAAKPLRTLTPVFEIEGRRCVLMTPQLAGIPKSELGPQVGHLEEHRQEIVAALDLLVTGV